MNIRHNVSRQLGLVNGYFFGLINHRNNPSLEVSNRLSGAADIERSIVFYRHSGILRFNSYSVTADNWSNAGGLQDIFPTPKQRQLAHDLALYQLAALHPGYFEIDNSKKTVFDF